MAIKDENTNKTWKYLNYSDEQANSPLATIIITEEILIEAKKLKAGF